MVIPWAVMEDKRDSPADARASLIIPSALVVVGRCTFVVLTWRDASRPDDAFDTEKAKNVVFLSKMSQEGS